MRSLTLHMCIGVVLLWMLMLEGNANTGTDTAPDLPPYPDFAIGPYPSALDLLQDSLLDLAREYNSSTDYSQVASQGYVLQAIGHLLWSSRDFALQQRDALVDIVLAEIEQLKAADAVVRGDGPAFGKSEAWDAFQDGSTNPRFTAYTWQSGMAALGIALIARYLVEVDHHSAAMVRDYGVALVDYWQPYYTRNADGGFFWYSNQESDAIAVHNTNALMAMASQLLAESGGPEWLVERPPACAALLRARMSGNPTAGYRWNYADDGYPASSRRPEDISHASVTLQLMRFAADRGWWSPTRMQGVAATLRDTIWSGNPAQLHGRVDGSSHSREWDLTRPAAIGYAAHGDAVGGDALVFDLARSIFFSSDLARNALTPGQNTVGNTGVLTLALLLAHTPVAFAGGSAWEMVAGEGDDALPSSADGGVRFYTVGWTVPADATIGGLTFLARRAEATTAKVLIDLPDGANRVAVSLIYHATSDGKIQQWNGASYRDIAPLTATNDNNGTLRWVRTTFELNPEIYFDYQQAPGNNILLRLTGATPTVHRIEATPLN